MRDFLLTAKRQRKEGLIWLICLLIAFVLNIASIIFYGTEWKELYTQLLWVLVISIGLYALSLLIRLPFYLLRKRK